MIFLDYQKIISTYSYVKQDHLPRPMYVYKYTKQEVKTKNHFVPRFPFLNSSPFQIPAMATQLSLLDNKSIFIGQNMHKSRPKFVNLTICRLVVELV